jgi:hypothetical protein
MRKSSLLLPVISLTASLLMSMYHVWKWQRSMLPKKMVFGGKIELDCYLQLPEANIPTFFSNASDPIRSAHPGFEALSNMLEALTGDVLKGPDARFAFRVFILRHGNAYTDRADMKPIYSSTTRRSGNEFKSVVVMKRDYDEEFAACVANGGCQRCQGGSES